MKNYISSVLFLFYYSIVFTQSNCDSLYLPIQNQIAKNHYNKNLLQFINETDKLIPKVFADNCWYTYLDLHVHQAQCAVHHENFDLANLHLDKANNSLNTYKEKLSQSDWKYLYLFLQNEKGNYLYKKASYLEAEQHYLQLINKHEDATLNRSTKKIIAAYYQFLGSIYSKQQRLDEAEIYYRKAIIIGEEVGASRLYHSYKLLADVLRSQIENTNNPITRKQTINDAINLYEIGLKQYKSKLNNSSEAASDPSNINRIIHNYIGISKIKEVQNKIPEAEEALQNAEYYLNKYDSTQSHRLYEAFATFYSNQNQLDEAILYQEKVLEKKKTIFAKDNKPGDPIIHIEVGDTYIEMARVYLRKGNYNRANEFLAEAKAIFTSNPYDKVPVYQQIDLFQTYGDYHLALYKDNPINKQQLEKAFTAYETAQDYIEQNKILMADDRDKEGLVHRYQSLYDNAIQTAYQLGEEYWKKAFYFSEAEKATKLIERFYHTNALNLSTIDEKTQLQEHQLREAIAKNLKALSAKPNEQMNKSDIYSELQKNYDALKQLLLTYKDIDPDYYFNRYGNTQTSIQNIQQKLVNKDRALIEYYISKDQKLFTWVITPNDFIMLEQELGVDVALNIKTLRSFMIDDSQIREREENLIALNNISHDLYTNFLGNVPLDPSITQLIIIPDEGLMKLVPFDMLSSQKNETSTFDTEHCLINRYSISYANSASLLQQQLMLNQATAVKGQGAFTVTQAGCMNEDPLVYIDSSFMRSDEFSQGNYFPNTTVSDFREKGDDFASMYISAHSLIDHNNPYFSSLILTTESDKACSQDNQLSFIEISAMDLKANIVMLYSCSAAKDTLNTNTSLADAFSYAGVKNFIAPIWNIPDEPSSDINDLLIEYLQEDEYPVALQKAKLQYIKDTRTENKTGIHPYFWASFVHYGNYEQQSINNFATIPPIYYVVGFAALFGGVLFLFRRRTKR